jgi:membrane protein DedA with SNARE-associated domain
MLQQIDAWIASAGPEAYVALGLASLIEYVFPPFPGDTVVVLGGVYAARGQNPWWLVFAVITLGSVIGAAIDYGLGLKIGERLERFPDRRLPFGLKHQGIRHAQERMRRVGSVLILINRFLPAVRGVLFVAAGAARISFWRVMLLGAASAMGWNVLLIGLGLLVGGNAERLEDLLRTYQLAVGAVLGIIALAFALRFVLRRRHRRS